MLNIKNANRFFPLLLTLLIFSNNISYSQNYYLFQQKYWYYRDRLKYFIVPGENEGKSQMADIRNISWPSKISWYNTVLKSNKLIIIH